MQYFPRKLPAEKTILTFNMAAGLTGGNLLVGPPVITISTALGTDAAPTNVLNGSAGLDPSSTQILVAVQGGIIGCEYLIEVECTTQQSGILLGLQATLPISSDIV